MRDQAVKIMLVLLLVVLAPASALARPQHRSATPVRSRATRTGRLTQPAPSATRVRNAGRRARGGDRSAPSVERSRPAARQQSRYSQSRYGQSRSAQSLSAQSRSAQSRYSQSRGAQTRYSRSRHAQSGSAQSQPLARHSPRARNEPRVDAAEPMAPSEREAATSPAPPAADIHVTHNRKVHRRSGTPDSPPAGNTPAGSLPPGAVRNAPESLGSVIPSTVAVVLPRPARTGGTLPIAAVELPVSASPSAAAPLPVAITTVAPTPALYTRSGRLIVPPALKGTHEILVHQNEMADRDGLIRVQDDADLERLRGTRMLVAIPAGAGIIVDERLPANRRFCRPWTAEFLIALGRAHYARFHTSLQVNSAVRTVEFQQHLLRTNGNAAPAEGSTASPHLTGQAVDLAKHGLSLTEIAWLRGYLLPLVHQGKVDVEEEFQQACFHISVYKRYTPAAAPRREIPGRGGAGSVLATALP